MEGKGVMRDVKPTPKQLNILANLAGVVPHPSIALSQRGRAARRHHYRLDGLSCTDQISSLLVQGLIRAELGGKLFRTAEGDAASALAAQGF